MFLETKILFFFVEMLCIRHYTSNFCQNVSIKVKL